MDEAAIAPSGSLSPSRAADFKTCPLMYRYRCVDRLPEPPSSAATRGTLVHAVLEELFTLPAPQRTVQTAHALLPAAWQRVLAQEPGVAALFTDDPDGTRFAEWITSAGVLLDTYFTLENPAGFEPEALEQRVEITVGDVRLRGIIDRVDVSAEGMLRVVDYKTGSSPSEQYEARALFQLKFYALVLWRLRGVVPAQLRLIYLADAITLSYAPDAAELERFERTVLAVWDAIDEALRTGDFRPNPGRACSWCSFAELCTAFGGTPPPYPTAAVLSDPRDAGPSSVPATA